MDSSGRTTSSVIQLNTDHGRFYQTRDGIFPSVTTVLSSVPNPHLEKWISDVGEEVAAKISKKASSTGTRFHTFCEDYLRKKNPKLDIFDKQSFSSVTEILDEISPVFCEKALWSNKLKVAGSIDCFGKFRNNFSVIDYKTTSREKYPGEFDSYWLQTAAYAQMIYEHTGRKINKLTIVMQNIVFGKTEIFESEFDLWIDKFIEVRENFKGTY